MFLFSKITFLQKNLSQNPIAISVPHIHCSNINNSHDMETIQIATDGWIDKTWYLHITEYFSNLNKKRGFPGGAKPGKNLPASAGELRDAVLNAGSGRSPGGGHGDPLQYFWLQKPMNRGVWWATVHSIAKSRTQLKQLSTWNLCHLRQHGWTWRTLC